MAREAAFVTVRGFVRGLGIMQLCQLCKSMVTKKSTAKALLALTVLVVHLAPVMAKESDNAFKRLIPTLDVLPAPVKLQASIQQNVSAILPTNIFGYAQKPEGNTALVSYVAPGSDAYKHGLLQGDRILAAQSGPDGMALIVERNKKRYSCTFNTRKPELAADSPALKGKVANAQALLDYQLVLLVDRSASMRTKDCPGDISRWQWCRNNTQKLLNQSLAATASNLAIIAFDTSYKTYERNNQDSLGQIFRDELPDGETLMAPALTEAFRLVYRQLQNSKPAMVVVISDGRPTDFDQVKRRLIDQSNTLSKPELLQVMFFQIGSGENSLAELDTGLVAQGAKADLVSVTPFTKVDSQGIATTLVDAALQSQKAQADKLAAQKSHGLSGNVQQDAQSLARRAAANRLVVIPQVKAHAPEGLGLNKTVKAHAVAGNRIEPVKPHPTGVVANNAKAKKVEEVDEKEVVRRERANQTYKY